MKREPNAVLVKEIRQALRGRFFRFAFVATLLLTTTVAVFVVLASDASGMSAPGRKLFAAVSTTISLGTLGFVPFSAFSAMGAEAEEGTLELLVLSGLRPRHIVAGKLLAALVQAVLLYSVMLPFLMIAFLLQGVDPVMVGRVIALGVLGTAAFSSLGIALALVARTRAMRLAMMACFGFVLFVYLMQGHVAGLMLLSSGIAGPRGTAAAFGFGSLGYLVLASLSLVFACTRLAHAEENRSTPARVLTTALLATGIAIALFGDPAAAPRVLIAATLVVAVPATMFATEPEPLGRRVRTLVPGNRALALLATPFLPGGGRGALWTLSALGALVLAALGKARDASTVAVLAVYVAVYLLLPSGILAPFSKHLFARVLSRIGAPGFALAGLLVPTLVKSVLGRERPFEHPGNPVLAIDGLSSKGFVDPQLALVLALAFLLVVAVNVPRVWRAVRETLAASAERRVARAERRADAVARA